MLEVLAFGIVLAQVSAGRDDRCAPRADEPYFSIPLTAKDRSVGRERMVYDTYGYGSDAALAKRFRASGRVREANGAERRLGVRRRIEIAVSGGQPALAFELADFCALRQFAAGLDRESEWSVFPSDEPGRCLYKLSLFVVERSANGLLVVSEASQDRLAGRARSAGCAPAAVPR